MKDVSYIYGQLCLELDQCPSVDSYKLNATSDHFYDSPNQGLEVWVAPIAPCHDRDFVDIDIHTGQYYGGLHSFDELPEDVQHIFTWYKKAVNGKGDINMSKKEINEAISNDIQKLASDLTKKREMEKASSSAEDIAKKLGVKLPKSKK